MFILIICYTFVETLKLKIMKTTKNYPIKIRVEYYKNDTNTSDYFNIKYATEDVVNSESDEMIFYEGLNHEANIKIIKL